MSDPMFNPDSTSPAWATVEAKIDTGSMVPVCFCAVAVRGIILHLKR